MESRFIGALLATSLLLGGCNTENTDETSSLDKDPLEAELPGDRPMYPSSLCKSQLKSLLNEASPSTSFPLELHLEAGEVRLLNGDFESLDAREGAIAYNNDPMYVYSGQGSAYLATQPFIAHATSDDDYFTWRTNQLSVWLYSVGDESVDFKVTAMGSELQRIYSSQPGFGYSGYDVHAEDFFTVEPHVWTKVTLDLEEAGPCALDRLEIAPMTDESVEFYLDDLRLLVDKE